MAQRVYDVLLLLFRLFLNLEKEKTMIVLCHQIFFPFLTLIIMIRKIRIVATEWFSTHEAHIFRLKIERSHDAENCLNCGRKRWEEKRRERLNFQQLLFFFYEFAASHSFYGYLTMMIGEANGTLIMRILLDCNHQTITIDERQNRDLDGMQTFASRVLTKNERGRGTWCCSCFNENYERMIGQDDDELYVWHNKNELIRSDGCRKWRRR